MRHRVLVVDGEVERGRALADALDGHCDCRSARLADEAMRALHEPAWAAVITAYDLDPGGSGLEVLQVAREVAPRAFRLLHVATSSTSLQHDARRLAAVHVVAAGRLPDLAGQLRHALDDLLAPAAYDPARVPTDPWPSRSPVGREFLTRLRAAAEGRAPVYLYGEPGTGRARAARMLREWREEWRAGGAPDGRREAPSAVILRVPTLRERPQDLPMIASCCLLEHTVRSGQPLRVLSAPVLDALLEREWRGNVGELALVLSRAVERAGARTRIEVGDLPHDAQPCGHPSLDAKDEGQRDCVLRELRSARTVTAAARFEGITRANYIRMMRRLGIVRADVVVGPAAPERGAEPALAR